MTSQAFHELALAELDAVYRLACHLARSSQEAEDFVQETYLRAFRAAASFTLGEQGIRPWLFKILHNVIHTSGARHGREQSVLDEFRQLKQRQSGGEPAMVDCSTLDWDGIDQRLKAAVAELPLTYRVVFLLSAVEALKYREIADVTEVPVGTVMSRLWRARSMLAARLAELGAEHGFKAQDRPAPNTNETKEGPSADP